MGDCVEIAFAGWERGPKGFRQELGREIFRWFREKVLDRERDFSLEGSFAAPEGRFGKNVPEGEKRS